MVSIVIAFPKQETAQSMKRILAQSGYRALVCTTGAQALAGISGLEDGIVVCGVRFADMMYTELLEYLPEGFHMLLLASAASEDGFEAKRLTRLVMPVKVHELLEAVELLEEEIYRRKKRMRNIPKVKSGEDRRIIERAKALLMEQKGLTEEEAHRYLQKRSMDNGTGIVEVAEMLLRLLQ